MRYWWVNQNQTYRQERAGGYLWSPKRKSNGARNPFYETMREAAPGDLVLSFQDTYIKSVGVVQSYCYECPKPAEFGIAGSNWEQVGWKVDIHYIDLHNQIRPMEHMGSLGQVLPERYSPLQVDGRGMQGIYLTELSKRFMEALAQIIGPQLRDLIRLSVMADMNRTPSVGVLEWEEHIREQIRSDTHIEETERRQIIMARRGQGKFRENVQKQEERCRITRVDRPEHLRASHLKPWRDCESHEERLDGENGLLLTPSIDHLFDQGFISFEDKGRLLISPVAHTLSLRRMGVPVDESFDVGAFSEGQRKYLDYHRDSVFLKAAQGG